MVLKRGNGYGVEAQFSPYHCPLHNVVIHLSLIGILIHDMRTKQLHASFCSLTAPPFPLLQAQARSSHYHHVIPPSFQFKLRFLSTAHGPTKSLSQLSFPHHPTSSNWQHLTSISPPRLRRHLQPSRPLSTANMTNYDEVLKGKYPAKAHAKKVADEIVRQGGDETGTIYLEGQKSRYWEVCLISCFLL